MYLFCKRKTTHNSEGKGDSGTLGVYPSKLSITSIYLLTLSSTEASMLTFITDRLKHPHLQERGFTQSVSDKSEDTSRQDNTNSVSE